MVSSSTMQIDIDEPCVICERQMKASSVYRVIGLAHKTSEQSATMERAERLYGASDVCGVIFGTV